MPSSGHASGLQILVSVVVRARDVSHDLSTLIARLKTQSVDAQRIQLVVVDNESRDNTAELAKAAGAIVVPISNADWSWGRALNRGIAASSGDVVIVLSADAHPVGCSWLNELLAAFTDPTVVALYGRQVPREDAPIDEWVRVRAAFPAEGGRWRRGCRLQNGPPLTVASNAFCAFRRCCWERVPFREDIPAEEGPWLAEVVGNVGDVLYRSNCEVQHSHAETASRQSVRLLDLALGAASVAGRSGLRLRDVAQICGAHAKRRFRNILKRDAPAAQRIAGLLALPKEIGFLMVGGLRLWRGDSAGALREEWW